MKEISRQERFISSVRSRLETKLAANPTFKLGKEFFSEEPEIVMMRNLQEEDSTGEAKARAVAVQFVLSSSGPDFGSIARARTSIARTRDSINGNVHGLIVTDGPLGDRLKVMTDEFKKSNIEIISGSSITPESVADDIIRAARRP